MDRWVWYAVLSMVFAGCTSVIAKKGLVGISGELGLAVRTVFVFGFIAIFASLCMSVFTLWKPPALKMFYSTSLQGHFRQE